MKQPISGVAPAELGEVTVMTVWPSISIYPLGKSLGRAYMIPWPNVLHILRLGNLIALASVPIALALYLLRVAPWVGWRYRLTNRRVIIQRGLLAEDGPSVALDGFDTVEIEVQEGQAWYDSGDRVFKARGDEIFRLPAVSRPDAFLQVCLNSHRAHVGVQQALAAEKQLA
jgi:hypothetical protein